MNIRKATAADGKVIYELGKSVSEFAVSEQTVNFWPPELLSQALASEAVIILVAEKDAGIHGFVIANLNRGLKKAIIENIYVTPEKRGQGIGDKLLENVLRLLPGLGCEYVAALVPPDATGALDLYQRSGFIRGETFVWLDKTLADSFKR